MDKNSLIGFILIAAVLIGFTFYNQPTAEQRALQARQDSIRKVQQEAAKTIETEESTIIGNSIAQSDSTSFFYEATNGSSQTVTLQNKDVIVKLNTKGGCIEEVVLKNYKDKTRKNPVRLFASKDASINYTFVGKKENLNTASLYFTPLNATDTSVTMRMQTRDGATLDFQYSLSHRFLIDLAIVSKGMQNHLMPNVNTVGIQWEEKALQQEKGYKFENQYATLTYKEKDGGTDYLNASKKAEEDIDVPLDWIAFKNQFFSAVLIANQDFRKTNLKSTPLERSTGYLKHYKAQMETSFDPSGKQSTTLQFYFGPNQYRLLRSTNHYSSGGKDLELERLVYLGWPLFRLINKYFTIYVFDWLTKLGFSMGIVLLLITILLRIIVYIPTKKSVMSSIKMRVLKPKMDELSQKYPNPEDNMKKQQEMMTLYSKYGVSPMGGCLPLLVQMPIWIAMFNFIPNAIELRQQSFLWADDLSTYDALIQWNKDIWLIGDHISLFCLLFCATNVVYSWLNMRMQKDSMMGQQAGQMKMMQWMMYGMPIFFFFIFNDYSSGLNYYYFISLLASALTMWYIRHTTDEKKVLAQLEANYQANKNNPKKMSGFAARLEQMQKEQNERMNARHKK